MVYPENFEQKIEFHKIRQLVDSFCMSSLGKEKTSEMHFSTSFEEIDRWLSQTAEFVRILEEEENFPADHFYDVRTVLRRLTVEGSWIDQHALFEFRRSLLTIYAITAFLRRDEDKNPKYPHLLSLAANVVVYPDIIKKIDAILDDFGQIKDTASPQLADIRRRLASTINSISKTLNTLLRNAQSEGFVEKDVTPAMRDGRLVIPVNPSYKRKIRGIIHDESASGKTVYVEPAEVVEANNRIRELENEERREVIRILTDFANYLRPFLPDLLEAYEFLGWIDFIQAKAKFALQIQAIKPDIADSPEIDWVQALHPLLYLSLQKQNRKVVPLDIALNQENRILIISGPNAGGKSVCLKTVGLLQYMVQCGLLIPLKENSHVGLFSDIFIDIGDEQSIENDLSTYSSHLLNMKFFLKNCNEKSLLLIDEFGSGTEPQIGAAIAEALLDQFNRKQSFGVITTHYRNIKHYANDHPGVINGAMLYDRHQMQPLFQLSIGNPGSSFAVEIAQKIGLPQEVIDRAAEIVGSDVINIDKYLQDISRDKRYWERKREEIRHERKRAEDLSSKYQAELEKIDKQKKEILAQAKLQAEQLLAESNAKIEGVIREIRQSQADKERTKQVRRSLNEFREQVVRKKEDETNKRLMSRLSPTKKKPQENVQLFPGDAVRLKGQTVAGKILEIQGKKAWVVFGFIKSTVAIDKLEKVSQSQLKKEMKEAIPDSNMRELMHERKLKFKPDLDVRGMRGDEALQAVMYFIDDAIQLGISRVRILHGTGSGALRQIIREYLTTVNGVTHFQDEHVEFGGAGITVVDLE
ncbi:endonuclease MutS2 [Anaerorudis cellulosivorans]|uniref:endonuclease MutS2 n=1 Tax=Anaerorudis cellulosivorans TaxID=3397862 RepID=UPI00221E3CD6|nr:endonuclease MutS2 [Seramator thermalis]MCW1736004.1 endonuclease MutS2 [Seramator thermalis]